MANQATIATGTYDPFTNGRNSVFHQFLNAILATAFFRCWHWMVMFTGWSTIITTLHLLKICNLSIQSTLLTVLGTVLGFVISYRTSSSFERYNEGRRYWSTIVYNSRTFARTVWFHVPDIATPVGSDDAEKRARTIVEKKTVLNLVEGFAVAVKHYLRGEEDIYYVDLYHLTKFLPAYGLPAGRPTQHQDFSDGRGTINSDSKFDTVGTTTGLPFPATTSSRGDKETTSNHPHLLPARNPPRTSIFDIWPFSTLVKTLTKRGHAISGKKAARERAKQGRGKEGDIVSHNVPLEITLYLSSYIAALQKRKVIDVATTNMLVNSLNGLVDSLTGLERILTTPIPHSYGVHLWTVTLVYCWALPFQLVSLLNWVTIPAVAVVAFIFIGFLVAGEEIENPFGFDRNDLNLDHFCHNIIRAELQSITTVPVPDPAVWAFDDRNDTLFALDNQREPTGPTITAEEWVRKGAGNIQLELEKALELERVRSRRSRKGPPPEEHENGHHHAEGQAAAAQAGAAGAAGGAAGDAGAE